VTVGGAVHAPRMIECQATERARSAAPTSRGGDRREHHSNAGTNAGGAVDLSLTTRAEGDRTVVQVGGEIDVYTAPKLREQLVDLVNAGQYHLVVDMENVEFLDSTGLGVLVGGLKRVRAHDGSLRLVCTQERILKIFRITGLTKVFPIHDSVDDAISATD
jgi:anti-sigma B factor antagonist